MFKAGINCWKVSGSENVAVLVDAKEYFEAVAWAALRAQKYIFILSWDIDSRISLLPEKVFSADPLSDAALPLAEFLVRLVERKPELEIFILTWDFLFLFADERENKKQTQQRFGRHPRIHFLFDKAGPIFASHHQKIIVVDDQIAFCGGLDLTQRRWDTSEHKPDDSRRLDMSGQTYGPFHDVQMLVQGEAAKDLGLLFRQRWQQRTGEMISSDERSTAVNTPELWPEHVEPLIKNSPVAISRTFPAYRGSRAVAECLSLFLDSIRAAKDYIYIENQYFTSRKVRDILAERLQEEHPPEILIVVRLHNSKWTEAVSMSVLRSQLFRRLKKYDKHQRLLVLCPYASVRNKVYTNLHSKVFIADDKILRVGSANVCGRSEGFDTECDLAIQAAGADRAAVRRFRDRLLAEHLDIDAREFENQLKNEPSLVAAILKYQNKSDKTLQSCPDKTNIILDWLGSSAALFDPESPRQFIVALARTLLYLNLLVLFIFAIVKIDDVISLETVLAWGLWVQDQPFAWVGLISLFAILTALPLPLLPLALLFSLFLPPLQMFICTMIGALLSASFHYGLSKYEIKKSHHGILARFLESEKFVRAQKFLRKEGFWPIVLLRFLPVLPFWLGNFCLGVVGVKYRHFLLSTFLGLLPGFLAIAYFENQISERVQHSRTLAALIGLFVIAGWALQKWIRYLVERRSLYVDGR